MSLSRIVFFFLVLMNLLGNARCGAQPRPVLTGTITLSPGWKPVAYLVQPRRFSEIASNYGGVVADSAVISTDGRFAFHHLPGQEQTGLFQLVIQPVDSRFVNRLLDDNPLISNYMPVVLQKDGSVDISAESGRLQASFSIREPSAENKSLLQLRDIRHTAFQEHLDGHTEAPDENTLLEHHAAWLRFRQPLMAFADSCAHLWPALVAIRWVSPEADYERVPEFLSGQCKKWSEQPQSNVWAQQLCEAANPEKLPVQIDQQIPDFSLPMASGDTTQLYSLFGSRLTIVDIWASWCAPCRRENREVLVPLYRDYKEKGLQIIGYSIDSSPQAWKNAITKDGAVWPHASHLTGDATPFLDVLHVTTIPANFIVDSAGRIIGKNLHGEALRAFAEQKMK